MALSVAYAQYLLKEMLRGKNWRRDNAQY